MEICKLVLNIKRGGPPDLLIEVDDIKIKLLDLTNDQRFMLTKLLMGGLNSIELPCSLERKK